MKQRGNGEGTVLKVGARNYKAIAVVGWKDEKHPIKRTKQGFRTAKEAREYISVLKGERAESRCFADYWEQIWEEVQRKGDSTQRKYLKARDRLEPLFYTDLRNIHISDLNALCSDLTYNSAHCIQNLVSKVYQLAMAEQYATVNLAPLMTLPTDSAEMPRKPFAKGEIEIPWSAWNEKKSALLGVILLSVYTGAMPIEVCRMKTENVQGRMIVDVGAKTEKRKESPIVIPNLLMPIVEWLCSNADADGYLLGMTEKQYRTAFKREMARLGLSTDHTPYDCRHTTATLLQNRLEPNALTEIMRHTDLKMTQHYKRRKTEELICLLDQALA